MFISEAVDIYLSDLEITNKSPDTVKAYKFVLQHFVSWAEPQGLELGNIKAQHIRAFMGTVRAKGYAPSSIAFFQRNLKAFLHWCQENLEEQMTPGLYKKVSIAKEEQKEIAIFSQADLKALLRAATHNENTTLRVRDRAILLLFIDTGIRLSEMVPDPTNKHHPGLLVKDVHLESNDSYILVCGKGNKQREVGPLASTTRAALRAYLRARVPKTPGEQVLFLNRSGRPLTTNGVDALLRRLAAAAGIEDVHAHKFRHTFAVNYLNNGGDVFKLSRLLGHTTLEVTQLYLRGVTAKDTRSSTPMADMLRL